MKLNKLLVKAALMITLIFSAASHAESFFFESGIIESISSRYMLIGDIDLDISPTVKVFKVNGEPELLINLKKGDYVEIEAIKENKNILIGNIWLLPNNPSEQ